MPRKDYQAQLDELVEEVTGMNELVLERLQMGLDALKTKDTDLAWQVIDGDEEVNNLYLDIEQRCVDLLALQQPVAGDLRLIVASFKIITDLERIGDLATNLGDYTKDAERDQFSEIDIQELGTYAKTMVEDAMRAYVERDADLCYEIDRRDDELDQKCEEISEIVIRELIESEDNGEEPHIQEILSEAHRLLLTVRDIERVGDHAVNIAARTLYMVDNNDELIW